MSTTHPALQKHTKKHSTKKRGPSQLPLTDPSHVHIKSHHEEDVHTRSGYVVVWHNDVPNKTINIKITRNGALAPEAFDNVDFSIVAGQTKDTTAKKHDLAEGYNYEVWYDGTCKDPDKKRPTTIIIEK